MNNFELYRNSYKSLIKVYIMLISLNFNERIRRINVYSLTLESYNNNINDVLDILLSLRNLDKDVILNLS